MNKLVRESINEDTNLYGKPWVTDITWEYVDTDKGEIIELPEIPLDTISPKNLSKEPSKKWRENEDKEVFYDDEGYPYAPYNEVILRPRGYLLMKLLDYMKNNPGMRYTEMQQALYDAGRGEGMWKKHYNKYTDYFGNKALRGYSSINLKRYKDVGYFEPRYTSQQHKFTYGGNFYKRAATRSKDTKYFITSVGESKLQQLKSQLEKYKK